MAMAFAPAAIMFPGLKINNPEVVTKSYPRFWDDLKTAGFEITPEL
jgi:3-phosphoshikimate 1-carboxyvinyltransferase